jgi:thiol-disulfide isomerase/thioredoxin
MPWLSVAAIGLLCVGVAGCSDDTATGNSSSGSADYSSAEVDTPALRAQKAAAGIDPCPDVPAASGSGGLPDVTLPCLGGGREVDLDDISGPAVINFWATYCGPCRAEAPIFEQVHKKLGDEVSVLGVDYQEPQPGRALAFADELGLTYPQLSDPHATTRAGLGIQGLPVTVLIDADGEITYKHAGPLDSEDELASLLRDHLGIDDDWVARS